MSLRVSMFVLVRDWAFKANASIKTVIDGTIAALKDGAFHDTNASIGAPLASFIITSECLSSMDVAHLLEGARRHLNSRSGPSERIVELSLSDIAVLSDTVLGYCNEHRVAIPACLKENLSGSLASHYDVNALYMAPGVSLDDAARNAGVALPDASSRIAELNPTETADQLLERLVRTYERGAIRALAPDGANQPAIANPEELAEWCHERGYAAPPEWAPDLEPQRVLPTDQDPEVYITPHETAQWIARHIDNPTESLQWAIDNVIMPALQRGDLTAWGISNEKQDRAQIPSVSWANIHLIWHIEQDSDGNAVGGQIWRNLIRDQTPLWSDVLMSRQDVLQLWPRNIKPSASSREYLKNSIQVQEISSAITAIDCARIVKKHVGYAIQDEPIIARAVEIVRERGVAAWAALQEIPDADLPGGGEPESRRKRIHKRLMERLKTPGN